MIASPYTIPGAVRASPPGFSRGPEVLPAVVRPPLSRTPSDFQVERVSKSSSSSPRRIPVSEVVYDEEVKFRDSVSRLFSIKNGPFSVSGRIPVDSSSMVLFFRTKSGITHSLDFPIDVDYNTLPALDVLIASCRPHQTSEDNYSDPESLFYPPSLPLTTSLEIANHPILDAIRSTLFPLLPVGHYLTAVRDKLEVIVSGGSMGLQPRTLRNDGRSATILVTLPVRFRGGDLIIRDPEGNEDRYHGRGGKSGDIEWCCFLDKCEYEVAQVTKGCRISISYGMYMQTYGTAGVSPEPLIYPSDNLLDLLSPILNHSRGRSIAFYVAHDHGVNPSEVLAETLVPQLKGGDSLLYHALKMYRLSPELRWTAGGYIWPVDATVSFCSAGHKTTSSADLQAGLSRMSLSTPISAVLDALGAQEDTSAAAGFVSLRSKVEASGAIPLSETDITILTDGNEIAPMIGKERVPFASGGELEKLVVNALIVAFIP
ncbi:hypothetical protein FISHEDRAFT_45220 [Fistulina hepatica ATCC 64428]|uniref:Uncharacterized protein n=1 Tax=Fistulina hepatica ATCC 64428 TaxID=1128425 RepID=A0A0D7AC05_9AGAR|nr:hypothetical protein FISHEDRAFT_45220 [Fistulina hepatica ATCC 64428]